MAPAVPIPDSCPTTVPVRPRLVSRSFVTIGVTAASRVPGTMMASVATRTSSEPPRVAAPAPANGVTATATPEIAEQRAERPAGRNDVGHPAPAQEPRAMAANAMPMTRVLVSRVSPR